MACDEMEIENDDNETAMNPMNHLEKITNITSEEKTIDERRKIVTFMAWHDMKTERDSRQDILRYF
jgi:hypothetical protein